MLIICPHCNQQFPRESDNKEYTENTILVEGVDDEMLINALIHAKGMTINSLTIEPKRGYSTIITRLKNIKSNSGFNSIKRLLIIADANSVGATTRFKDILQQIDQHEFSIPDRLGKLSASEVDKKQCGIFLFPNNHDNGVIEDLCLQAVTHPGKLECIENHITCIKNKGLLTTNASDLPKSKFHIYMSTSEKPTGSIGGATQAGEINLQSNIFNDLVSLLQQLQ